MEPVELTPEEQSQDSFINEIKFQYIFEKKIFIFNYYTVLDLFNELCGLGNALAQFLSQFYLILVILFAIQMNYLIKTKHK